MYKGPMDKDNGVEGGKTEGGQWKWVGSVFSKKGKMGKISGVLV